MSEHKFQEKLEVTYEKLLRTRFEGLVSLTKELEQEFGRERMLEIVGSACDREAAETLGKQLEGDPIENFDDFVAFLDDMAKDPMHVHTQTMTMEREDSSVRFDVRECLWAKTFQDMGDAELGYVACCKPDFAMLEVVSPKLRLERTKTLMQGDECCDHIWSWED